jgi:glycosyltransferase 2 family protein
MSKLTRRLLAAMLLGVLVYGAFALYTGVDRVGRELQRYAWSTFALACGLAFSNYVLRFLKWEYYLSILKIRGVPKGESFLTFLSGFVLTVTPGKVGEVFKSLILFQLRGVPIERTAPIVIAERVTDLIGVIVMITLGSLSFPGGLVWASAGGALVLLLLVFVASPSMRRRMIAPLPRLPGALGRIGARVAPKVEVALGQLRDLTTPGRLVYPALLSIAAWSLEGIALWIILGGFGEHPALPLTAFIYATATLAGALIPLPGGLGVTDGLLKAQMGSLAHVGESTSMAAMLLVRFATLWFAVVVGFAALAILRALHPSLKGEAIADSPGPNPAPGAPRTTPENAA